MAYFFFSFSFSFFLFAKESDMIFVSLIEAIFFVNSFSDFGVVKKQQNIISPITLDSWQTVQMITKDFLTLEKNKTSVIFYTLIIMSHLLWIYLWNLMIPFLFWIWKYGFLSQNRQHTQIGTSAIELWLANLSYMLLVMLLK